MACVIAAPSSGSGKTLLSLLIASWARCQGTSLQTFMVGPDYLDPQQLTAISGRDCRNLDLILCGSKWVTDSFHYFGGSAEMTIVEGVMGLFDGIGDSEEGSTADIARRLKLPVILVVNASGQAASLAPLIKGFRDHDPQLVIAGVVLNRIKSNRHENLLEQVLNGINVKLLGSIKENPILKIPSKSLGLVPAHEITDLEIRMKEWAKIAESSLHMKNFKGLLSSPKLSLNPMEGLRKDEVSRSQKIHLPIAIAQDKAFHFRYPETKDCLEELGMPLLPWQPLKDEPIPKEAKGLIIPGGFPEQYAEQLSKSSQSLEDLRANYGKKPIYAECGGMLLLGQSLTNSKGQSFPMAGLLPFNARKSNLQVGYRKLFGTKKGLIIRKGDQLIGHEFHRWETTIETNNSSLQSSLNSPWKIHGWQVKQRSEGWSNENIHASWIHLHWASCSKLLNRWRLALRTKL